MNVRILQLGVVVGVWGLGACSDPCRDLRSLAQQCDFVVAEPGNRTTACEQRTMQYGDRAVQALDGLVECVVETPCGDAVQLNACAADYAEAFNQKDNPCRELEGWSFACGLEFDAEANGCLTVAAQPGNDVENFAACMMSKPCFEDVDDARFDGCGGLAYGTVDNAVVTGCQLAFSRAAACGDPTDAQRCFTLTTGRTPESFLAMNQCIEGLACDDADGEAECEDLLEWVAGGADVAASCDDIFARLDQCSEQGTQLPTGNTPALCLGFGLTVPTADFTSYAGCFVAQPCGDDEGRAQCAEILVDLPEELGPGMP